MGWTKMKRKIRRQGSTPASFYGWGAIFATLFASTQAAAVSVHVSAATRLEAHAERSSSPGNVVIRGSLRDDVGSPVAESHVAISFFGGAGAGPALALPLPKKCANDGRAGSASPEPHVAPDEYVVDTDAQGAFCFETSLSVDPAMMKLRFRGSALYDATAAEVPIELGRSAIGLAFDPEPSIISLDHPTYTVSARVTAPGETKTGWQVKLTDETGRALGSSAVGADGSCRVDVKTSDLGGPGAGRLALALEGTPENIAPAVQAVERHARVTLETDEREPSGVPEDGIVTTLRVGSSRGAPPSGSIEAELGGRTVGAGLVREGRASVAMTFGSPKGSSVVATLRYLPDAPWWEPAAPLPLCVAVHPPSPWRRAPLVFLAIAVAAWMLRETHAVRTFVRPQKKKIHVPAPVAVPAVEIVRERRDDEGWMGRVVDAHDGFFVRAARVSIVMKGFPGIDPDKSVLARAETDSSGRFSLQASAPLPSGAVIRVEAPLHATLEQPLPRPSELQIPLVARRRKILARLVDWARAEWGVWDGAREPTPEQVAARAARRAARGSGNADRTAAVEAWARAVESTAFGAAPVDEPAEQRVTSLEPKS
jgi:hypothetical protein